MPPELVPENNNNSSNNILVRWLFAIVMIIVAIVLFSLVYAGFLRINEKPVSTKAPVATSTAAIPDDLKGVLFVSFGVASTTTQPYNHVVNNVINTHTGELSYVPYEQLASGTAMTMQYSVASNNTKVVFLGSPYIEGTSSLSIAPSFSVYRADLDNTPTYEALLVAMQSAEIVSSPTDEDYFRESPTIAANGSIIYSSLPKSAIVGGTVSGIPANSWNIYLITGTSTPTVVAHGLYPQWIDATHFAYLKNDGLYMYDVMTSMETKEWDMPGVSTLVRGVNISDDGQFIAITDPANAQVHLMHVNNWETKDFTTLPLLPVVATNPVFSPNDHYLALLFLGTNPNDPQGAPITQLRYYSLTTWQLLPQALTLNTNNVNSIFMTEWR